MNLHQRLILDLQNWNPLVRAWAAAELGESWDLKSVPPLIQALRDGSSRVRVQAATSLGKIGDHRSIAPLCRALEDPVAAVGDAASTALLVFEARAVGELCEALCRGSRQRSPLVTDALVRLGPAAVPELTRLINSSIWQVRQEAVIALGRIGSSIATPYLIQKLSDPNEGVRIRAVEAMGPIRTAEAVDALIAVLQDKSPSVRLRAASALGRPGFPQAVEALIPCLKHRDTVLRTTVADALGRIGSGKATLPLVAALEANLGMPAARALDRIAEVDPVPELRAALPALRKAARTLGTGAKQMAFYFALNDKIEVVTRRLGSLPLPARPPAGTTNLPGAASETALPPD